MLQLTAMLLCSQQTDGECSNMSELTTSRSSGREGTGIVKVNRLHMCSMHEEGVDADADG